jgi:hypothetical protein
MAMLTQAQVAGGSGSLARTTLLHREFIRNEELRASMLFYHLLYEKGIK